jgi:hypothetical protein
MADYKILFHEDGEAMKSEEISGAVGLFPGRYAKPVRDIISNTDRPDLDRDLFMRNCAILLPSFKMTRAGVFKGVGVDKTNNKLEDAWNRVGNDLMSLRGFFTSLALEPRSRILLLLDEASRKKVVGELWNIFKKLLPVTMSSSSYGLVGASKILFSVFPEIALPIDNTEWRSVFKTVDFGDVIYLMAEEIRRWEKTSRVPLDSLGKKGLMTLPAVYNVMAMEARKLKKK